MAVIVIDPGHGGTQTVGGSSPNNATGPAGTKEKTITLALGLSARSALANLGHTVRMTRTADVNLGLAARAHVARDDHAAAFVSIHLNASDAHNAQGTETWLHTRHSSRSQRLAERVQARVVEVTGLRDRGVKAKGLGVLAPGDHDADTACCLVEVSFLDRADEEQRLLQAPHQQAIANGIANAITDYLAAVPAFSAVPAATGREVHLEDAISVATSEARPAKRRARPDRAKKKGRAVKSAKKKTKRSAARRHGKRPTKSPSKKRAKKSQSAGRYSVFRPE